MNEITITVTAIDDDKAKVRAYKSLSKAAFAFAHNAVGQTPTIDITGQAVSDDGITTVSVEGCSIWDLFPDIEKPEPPKQPEPEGKKLKIGDRVMVDDGNDAFTGTLIEQTEAGWKVRDDDKEVIAPDVLITLLPNDDDDDSDDDELTGSRMSIALRKARVRYVKVKHKDGQSAHCNDPIARALEDLEPGEVAAMADKITGERQGFHYNKYQHLNPGQIRMNSGNKIRTLYKKADEDGKSAILSTILGL